MIATGIFENIPNETYHHDRQYITNSGLQKFSKNQAEFKYLQNNPNAPTPAMIDGTIFHDIMEYGLDAFYEKYSCLPEGNGATKAIKQAKADIIEAGLTPLKPDLYNGLIEMHRQVDKHPVAGELLRADGRNELTIASQDLETGVKVKVRPDKLTNKGVVVDYKTTLDASPAGFAKSVVNFGYHRQAALYLDVARLAGIEVGKFLFICVEKSAPYLVAVYELEESAIELGRKLNNKALSDYSIALDRGEWKGYSDNIEILKLPAWAYAQALRGNDEY